MIIADAGPLIAFGRIKHLSLLRSTLGEIIVPWQVLNERLINTSRPGAREIEEAIEKKIIIPHDDPSVDQFQNLFDTLGSGEATAIILAFKLKVGLLIDERLGRQVAQKMNLRIIGTAGVLLLAKEKKLIEKIVPLIQELKNAGYFLSTELIDSILKHAKEKMI